MRLKCKYLWDGAKCKYQQLRLDRSFMSKMKPPWPRHWIQKMNGNLSLTIKSKPKLKSTMFSIMLVTFKIQKFKISFKKFLPKIQFRKWTPAVFGEKSIWDGRFMNFAANWLGISLTFTANTTCWVVFYSKNVELEHIRAGCWGLKTLWSVKKNRNCILVMSLRLCSLYGLLV